MRDDVREMSHLDVWLVGHDGDDRSAESGGTSGGVEWREVKPEEEQDEIEQISLDTGTLEQMHEKL